MKREIFIDETSFWMSLPMIIAMSGCCIAAMYFSLDEIAVLLLFLIGIAVMAHLYSYLSLRKVTIRVTSVSKAFFPGECVCVSCRIHNAGKLPVLSLLVRIPIERNGSVTPSDPTEYRALSDAETSKARLYGENVAGAMEKRIPFLKQRDSFEWSFELRAVKRGEALTENVLLYCGEPFGVTNAVKTVTQECRTLVCSKIVPVRIEPLLYDLTFSNRGAKSMHRDVTLICGNREYASSDGTKSINWRMLASHDRLMVNLYEPFCMKQAHLLIDGESFNGKDSKKDAFEATLQILFSLILKLYERGIGCGISLPQSKFFGALNLFNVNQETLPMIAGYLAKYQLRVLEEEKQEKPSILLERSSFSTAVLQAREKKQQHIPKSRSIFRVSDLLQKSGAIGAYFYVTYDAENLQNNKLLDLLPEEKITIVSYKKCRSDKKYCRTIDLSAFSEEA